MLEFRLTTGEDNTKWGHQVVIFEDSADDLYSFLDRALGTEIYPEDVRHCWIDTGNGTIPVALDNILWDVVSEQRPELTNIKKYLATPEMPELSNIKECFIEFMDYVDSCGLGALL